jgi:hypothetical protein
VVDLGDYGFVMEALALSMPYISYRPYTASAAKQSAVFLMHRRKPSGINDMAYIIALL